MNSAKVRYALILEWDSWGLVPCHHRSQIEGCPDSCSLDCR